MHINPTVWWILGLLFVYIFGLFEGRNQGYKKRKKEEDQEKEHQALSPSIPAPMIEDKPGLLRIKNENGSLVLDLDGSRVETNSLTFDQRKRLIEIINIMRPWLEAKQGTPPQTVSTATPPQFAQSAVQTPVMSVPVSAAVPPPQPSAPQKDKPAAQEDRPVAPAGSIVGQIDSILQVKLAGSPLSSRGIYLSESPEGGVIVNIGTAQYAGVDEVIDPDVKALLRAAIAEWEKKYTPGL